MRTVDEFLTSIQKIDIPYQIELSLIDSASDYVQIQQEQIRNGLRRDDKPIFNLITGSDQYSPGYAKKKGKSSPIDLYDTGSFSEGIFLHVDNITEAVVDSADDKTESLIERYGNEIFGLNTASMGEFLPLAKETLIQTISEALNQ
jgi:hypothetical protein